MFTINEDSAVVELNSMNFILIFNGKLISVGLNNVANNAFGSGVGLSNEF